MKKICIAFLIIFSSCGSNQDRAEDNRASDVPMSQKLHGNYLVSEVWTEYTGSENILFRFDSIKSEVAGNAGCNRFNSVYRQMETSITFQPAASTKMYCEGKMEREKEIIDLLPEITEIIRKNEELLLLSEDNELLLKLKKTN